MLLRARHFEFRFPRPALIMGVVNVTPDSFSDGGQFLDARKAIAQALRLVEEGADILDIGGESTRPNATPVPEDEELRRVLPVIRELAPTIGVPISIDTMKPAVARAALEAGASVINDVAAHRTDASMAELARDSGAVRSRVRRRTHGHLGHARAPIRIGRLPRMACCARAGLVARVEPCRCDWCDRREA